MLPQLTLAGAAGFGALVVEVGVLGFGAEIGANDLFPP
jgi:hypothetical protein